MTTKEIANRLIELCQQEQYEQALKELFSSDAISIEPHESADFARETKGLEAIITKGHKFESMVEKSHGNALSQPLVTDHSIAFTLTMDITMKGQQRATWHELCVYTVKNGKINSEQFFL